MTGFHPQGLSCNLCIKWVEHGHYLHCRRCKKVLCMACHKLEVIPIKKIVEFEQAGIVRIKLKCGSEGCPQVFKEREMSVDD